MKAQKKIVDLIYVEPKKNDKEIVADRNQRVDIWQNRLKEVQELTFEDHFDSSSPDITEIMQMRKFLTRFLIKRLQWVCDEVEDKELRRKYLNVLPPFTQHGGIKTLLFHFFQVQETKDKKSIMYQGLNDVEKEVRVLWDIYKLRKTIQSINILLKGLKKGETFPSIFSVQDRIECLEALIVVFKLMFKMCIQKNYQVELYQKISPAHVSAEAILKRRETGKYFVYPHVLQKFDYRNHFFFIYFFPGMKAKIGDKTIHYHYNYLDFEIIKQEFLTHWLQSKLKNNSLKTEVYSKYAIGDKTIAQIVQENPSKELELLQQLPLEAFNNITADVNDRVSEELKSGVNSFGESVGEFARAEEKFEEAKGLAGKTLDKLKSFVQSKKAEVPGTSTEPVPEPEPIPEPPKPPEKPTYQFRKLKKKEIDFPFLLKSTTAFSQKLNLIRVRMGKEFYKDYSQKVSDLLNSVSESYVVKQRTPKHEWTLPYMITENKGDKTTHHLVILGAEAKAKQLSMGYGAGGAGGAHSFACYIIYAREEEAPAFGAPIETRIVRGKRYNEYDIGNPEVMKFAQELFAILIENT